MNQKELDEMLKRNNQLEILHEYGGEPDAAPVERKKRPAPPPMNAEPIYSVVAWKTVDIEPYGKARPRVTQGGQHVYMPPEYEAWREAFAMLFGQFPIPDLVRLTVLAVRPMPKSWSNKERDLMRGRFATPKPDADNILGAVMDALFTDDDIVVQTVSDKIWGDEAAMDVKIEAIQYVEAL